MKKIMIPIIAFAKVLSPTFAPIHGPIFHPKKYLMDIINN